MKEGTAYFVDIDIQNKTFSEGCIELYQQESELSYQYQETIQSSEVEFMGKKLYLSARNCSKPRRKDLGHIYGLDSRRWKVNL